MAVVAAATGFVGRPTLSSDELEAVCGMARLCSDQGRCQEALAIYRLLLKRTKELPFVRLGLARVYFQSADFARAEKEYRAVLQSDPLSPVALYNLGCLLQVAGRTDEALECLRRFQRCYGNLLPELSRQAGDIIPDFAIGQNRQDARRGR